ncbi:hypothetical protein RCL1_008879 [Eukaryota sp. TZLM3-RCL]
MLKSVPGPSLAKKLGKKIHPICKALARLNLKTINERAHWEIARGNKKQNIDYCSKGQDIAYSLKADTKEEGTKKPVDEYVEMILEEGHAAAAMQHPVTAMTRGRVNPKELAQLKKSVKKDCSISLFQR